MFSFAVRCDFFTPAIDGSDTPPLPQYYHFALHDVIQQTFFVLYRRPTDKFIVSYICQNVKIFFNRNSNFLLLLISEYE